jgi:uncharacterized membrane protein
MNMRTHGRKIPRLHATRLLAALSLLAASRAMADPPAIASVGVFTNGVTSAAEAVSADGLVVVGTTDQRAFRWTASGGLLDLGALSGGTRSFGRGTSADGSVVIVRSESSAGIRGAIWTAQQGLQSIGVLPGGSSSDALAINADGTAVVGSSDEPYFNPQTFTTTLVGHAVRWTLAGGMSRITGPSSTGTPSWATSISSDGLAAAGSTGAFPNQRAFRWTQAGGFVDLGLFPTANYSYAAGISGDSTIVAGYGNTSSGYRAFRWSQAGGMQNLGVDAGTYSVGMGVSRDGRVVVGWHGTTGTAMAYSARTGMFDLRDRLVSLGVDMTGWVLQEAHAASADGHVIVGIGTLNGQGRGFVATLPPFGCPGDFNADGALTVQDVFDFLNAWFAGDPHTDINGIAGLSVQDIFDFLNAWFQGCP